jgi:hypothetical protein
MLQRIQTIYLFASAILLFCCLAVTIAIFSDVKSEVLLTAFIIVDSHSVVYTHSPSILSLGVTMWFTALISIITIFLFKKRLLQLRFIRYTQILKIALLAYIGYLIHVITSTSTLSFKPSLGLLLIVIAFITDWLAYRAIKKDEELVRSVDRIR